MAEIMLQISQCSQRQAVLGPKQCPRLKPLCKCTPARVGTQTGVALSSLWGPLSPPGSVCGSCWWLQQLTSAWGFLQVFLPLLIWASWSWNSAIRAPASPSLPPHQHQQPRFCWSERLTWSIWPPRDRDYKRAGIKGNLILSPHLPLCLLSSMFANRISSCCLQFQKHFPFSLGLMPATSAYCYNLILQDVTSLSSF